MSAGINALFHTHVVQAARRICGADPLPDALCKNIFITLRNGLQGDVWSERPRSPGSGFGDLLRLALGELGDSAILNIVGQ